jgi:RNA polymerase sigma-70 factor (ECF subfamily)
VSGPTDLIDQIIALLPRLRRFALLLTRHQDDADDLVQAGVERALSKLGGWREGSRLDSWMFKIMQNLWIDQMRARRTRGVAAPDFDLDSLAGSDGRADIDARLTLRATLEATLKLPEDQRAVVLMVIVEGFSYREAAEVLEVPVGTVMSRLSRARQALERTVLGDRPAPLLEARS